MNSKKIGQLASALGIVLALVLWTQWARASLVVHDFQSTGDGLLVQDTVTGLQWLSPRVTAGVSYNSVVGGFDGLVTAGGGGFSVASAAQVKALFANNFNNPTTTSSPSNVADVQAFFNVFGITQQETCSGTTPPGSCPRTEAWSLESPGNIEGLGMITTGNDADGNVIDFTDTIAADGSVTDSQLGTWLVRGAVQTPAGGEASWAGMFALLLVAGYFTVRQAREPDLPR